MRSSSTILALAAAVLMAGCTSEEACNEEILQKKTEELMGKMMEVAFTQPEKIEALQPKMQDIGQRAQGTGNDLRAACKAVDEMLAELAK